MATGTLTPPWFLAFTDSTGAPLAGGKIYTYVTGTSTPATVYQNSTLTTAWSNPIILPADGKVTIYQTSNIIKAVVYDSADVLQDTFDPIMSSGTFIVDGPPNISFTDADGVTHTTAALVDSTITTVPSTSFTDAIMMQLIVTPTTTMVSKRAAGINAVIVVPSSNTQELDIIQAGRFVSAVSPASGVTSHVAGVVARGAYSGAGTVTVVMGGRFTAAAESSSVAATVRGVWSAVTTAATASGTDLASVDAFLDAASTGTFTNAYGVRVNAMTNAGTFTNTYGVYVGDVTAGTQTNQAFSFYASDASALNYFAGDTGIGVAAPSARVHVVKTTEQLRVGYDASNYLSVTVGSTGAVTLNATGAGAAFTVSDALTVATGFGCNGATAQTAATVGAALNAYTTGAFGLNSDANMQALYNTVVAIRAALVANGIAVI